MSFVESKPLEGEPHASRELSVGMVGAGMIFEETYRPVFEQRWAKPLYGPDTGPVRVRLAALASRTGKRTQPVAAAWRAAGRPDLTLCTEPDSIGQLLATDVTAVCVATPDDRHFAAALAALKAGKHVLIEKPAVLSLPELVELQRAAAENQVLAKVVYHKLFDPDHKKLRTFVQQQILQQVQNGYCSLLEPISIAKGQFAEWIHGRNPATYVAVHYIKLIDFTFGGRLVRVTATGQRGLVGPADGSTWDAVQLRLTYHYPNSATNSKTTAEASFDIHTSWVTPDNFPGYVEQEVQFRFSNGIWNGHSRKRGVELTVADQTPHTLKTTLNNHYNATFLEPWEERATRGYGLEAIERFFEEVAFVEWGGAPTARLNRYQQMQALAHNSVDADRPIVAAVSALEQLLAAHAAGFPDAVITIDQPQPGIHLWRPGQHQPETITTIPVYPSH